jgi:hypothetical protein
LQRPTRELREFNLRNISIAMKTLAGFFPEVSLADSLVSAAAIDATLTFTLEEIREAEMIASKWPNAPLSAAYECFAHNSD